MELLLRYHYNPHNRYRSPYLSFGDLHASNYIEAFFIITISLFACLFFGYNLNYIGHLISSIHIDEEEKL